MSDRFRYLAPPILLIAGYFVGRDLGPITITHGSLGAPVAAGSVAAPVPAAVIKADRGRASAESSELRDLREAEALLFPEQGTRDFDLSDPEAWDRSSETAGAGIPRGDGTLMAPRNVDQVFEGLKQPAMKVRHHPRVARYVEYFTSSDKGRKLFATWLRRSGKYRAMMEQALQERNLPKDLVAVACIESGFWPTARSTAGAVGLWQFMPSTARAYGLVVDRSVDERRNVWRSTEAASQHLADLHERFQSWELALAAYNMGYKQLVKRLHDAGAQDFWALADAPEAMPRETRLYVPKIMAVALILANLQHFNFDDIEELPALAGSEIKVPPGVRLSLVARAAGTSLRHIHELNEEFRGDLVPDRGGPITLHIPPKGVARARAMLPKLMKKADGDTLDKDVAPDFDWGTEEISSAKKASKERGTKNDDETPAPGRVVRNKEFAGAGKGDGGEKPSRGETDDGRTPAEPPPENDPEIVPEPTTRAPASTPASGNVAKVSFQLPTTSFPTTLEVHEVKRGDNLWKLSERYGVPRKTIAKDNHLKHPDTLVLGKVIVVNVPKRARSGGGGVTMPITVDLAAAASAAGSSLSSEPSGGRDASARLESAD